jgi:Pilus formation protein N terminal region
MRRSALEHALGTVAVVTVALAATGCSTSPSATLKPLGTSPGATLTQGLATVPVGVVLGFAVGLEGSTPATAAVDDPTLATVAPAVQGSEFVLIGLATGQTTLHIYVNNQEATELPVQVVASAD